MKKKGLIAKSHMRFRGPNPSGIQAVAGKLLHREFCPIQPDLVWDGEITSIDS
jgi:hypothetical protein